MATYEFLLQFLLPSSFLDQENLAAQLYNKGCSDALIGIGVAGRIALDFSREAPSAFDAVSSAIADVEKAVPGSRLIEVGPDLVGISDLAEIWRHSRQNARKVVLSSPGFPLPVWGGHHELFYLVEVLAWMTQSARVSVGDGQVLAHMIETAQVARAFNLVRQLGSFPDKAQLRKTQKQLQS